MGTFQTQKTDMALETAQFINGLNPSNPAGADRLHQGDDHIRLLKQSIKNTFPNIKGPVTLSEEQLNAAMNQVPIGIVTLWYGESSAIPSGWALCNGQEHDRADGTGKITTPNLVDRIPIGAGPLVDPGEATGKTDYSLSTSPAGAHSHTITGGEHSHSGTSGAHALTEAQLPPHKHLNGVVDKNDNLFNHGGVAASPTRGDSIDGNSSSGTREGYTTSVGGGEAHSHSLTINESSHSHTVSGGGEHTHSASLSILPPVLGIHFIMKL